MILGVVNKGAVCTVGQANRAIGNPCAGREIEAFSPDAATYNRTSNVFSDHFAARPGQSMSNCRQGRVSPRFDR